MTGVFTTAYAAPIAYYQALLSCDHALLEVNESFKKQTIRNRCVIATSNGTLTLTIPLSNRRNHMMVSEVSICYKHNWQRQHIKSMETAYHSSPFFEFYVDELRALYQLQPANLLEWNKLLHQLISKFLKVSIDLKHTLTYEKVYNHASDFRTQIWYSNSPKIYHQVFENKLGFIPDLSIYDLLFNCGIQSLNYLRS